MRLLTGWLWDRQPRIVDYIVIAVIAAILASVIVTVASSGGQDVTAPKATLTGSSTPAASSTAVSSTSSVPTEPVVAPTVFYAPTENISCSLHAESAQCSVVSANLTFIIPPGGGPAYTTPGLSVPPGDGAEAPYGTERSNGAIVCDIPPEKVAAGVTCRDIRSGHGFEASRVAARQAVY
jgi:hypothetical protein